MKASGFEFEANYISVIAQWHEASDGRGLTEEQRSAYNRSMLDYLLEEIIPNRTGTMNLLHVDINV